MRAASARGLGLILYLTAWLTTLAWADEPSIPRIGVLTAGAAADVNDALRDGLRELGYIEGKSILIEWREMSGNERELGPVASRLAADTKLIVVFSTPAARAALQATSIPVVFLAGDPVGTGLAESLARPGGRSTGVSMLNPQLAGKRIQLLQQLAPSIRRIFFLMNPANPVDIRMLDEAQNASRARSVELVRLDARNTDELDVALHNLPRHASGGLFVASDTLFVANRAKLTRAVRAAKVPAIFPYKEYQDSEALMSYGPSAARGAHKLAPYVDRILKGTKPSELPIEQMSQYELVINLRVAREMHIKVPQDLLYRADEVIR